VFPAYTETFIAPATATTRTSAAATDTDGPLSPPTITLSGLPSFLTYTQIGSTFQIQANGANNVVSGDYNITYVLFDGINTVT